MLTSQGIIRHSFLKSKIGDGRVGQLLMESVEDDDQGSILTFTGDSSSPYVLQSEKYGTVLTGIALSGTENVRSQEIDRLNRLRDASAHTRGLSGIDEIVFEDGGYTLNWVYADDWLRVQDMLTIGTNSSYTGTTAMNGKEIVCEITATRPNIKGNDLTSTKSKSFNFGVSGGTPPYDGFTGEVAISDVLARNSFYEGTLLYFDRLLGNTAYQEVFPPVTAFCNVGVGSTAGASGDIVLAGTIDTQDNETYAFTLPSSDIGGNTLYANFYTQNVLGTTGNPDLWVELGKANTYGHGPTFTAGSFSWSDETPSAGDTIIGSVSGWTANPDRGQSSFQQTGVGFTITPPTVNFTGPTFGITIPAEAEAGDKLIVSVVTYVNVYDSELALAIQQLTIA